MVVTPHSESRTVRPSKSNVLSSIWLSHPAQVVTPRSATIQTKSFLCRACSHAGPSASCCRRWPKSIFRSRRRISSYQWLLLPWFCCPSTPSHGVAGGTNGWPRPSTRSLGEYVSPNVAPKLQATMGHRLRVRVSDREVSTARLCDAC